jgi:hypothetical protein
MRTELTSTPLFAFIMANWRDQGSSGGRGEQRANASRGLQSAARARYAAAVCVLAFITIVPKKIRGPVLLVIDRTFNKGAVINTWSHLRVRLLCQKHPHFAN